MDNKILLSGKPINKLYEFAYLLKNVVNVIVINEKLSSENNSAFIHETLKYCLDNQISGIFNISHIEAKQLIDNNILFEEFGIDVYENNEYQLEIFSPYEEINSFEDFSTKSLKIGYPENNILVIESNNAISKSIIIDENADYSIFNDDETVRLPFIKFSKNINQKLFQPFYIIPIENKIISINFAVFQSKLLVNSFLNVIQKNKLIDLVNYKNLNGCYNIIFNEEEIVLLRSI